MEEVAGANPVGGRRPGRDTGRVGHVDVAGVRYQLPDGRVLLEDVSFRVGEGAKVALVGANGAGKTTLLRIVTGDLAPQAGTVTRSGGLGVMRQMVGAGLGEDPTVADLLLSVAPPRVRAAAYDVDACERALMDTDDEKTQMRYAGALAEFADAGGYDIEVVWDVCTMAGLGVPYDRAKYRSLHDAVRRRAEAAGPGVPPARTRTRCCCSTSRTTSSTCRARSGSRSGSPPRRRRSSTSATTGSCSTTPRPGWSPSSWARPATWCGRTRAGSPPTTRPGRTGSPASRSCAGAGTRSTPSSRPWC